ncbi:hypothetical protein ACFYWF_06710 [Streptomyces sp. NPDC003344]|uniref:hypothetical protein n=1 Tax=Streptomyces sp. NPDC003344 TaxID=3364682 RepID=UPI0036B5BC35
MDYRWILPFEPTSFEWKKRGDQWLSQLSHVASDVLGAGSYVNVRTEGHDGHLRIEVTATVAGPAIDARLLIELKEGEKPQFFLIGNSGALNQEDLSLWVDLTNRAKVNVGRVRQHFKWMAVIGQVPGLIPSDVIRLNASSKVSSLRIIPSGKRLNEVRPHPGSISQWQPSAFNPIIVRGKSEGHDWWAAQKTAAVDLNKLAGILSVAWGSRIGIRELPFPLELGQLAIPDTIPWISDAVVRRQHDHASEHDRAVSLPDWMQEGWQAVGKSGKVHAALSMYMEGERLQSEHPSLSLVAFVSAIEAIALDLFRIEKSEEIAATFRETLKLAVGSERAEKVSFAYTRRSRTVHAGRLHGNEFMPGGFPIDFAVPPNEEFWWILHLTHDAARRILLRVLRGEVSAEKIRRGEVGEPDVASPLPIVGSSRFTG